VQVYVDYISQRRFRSALHLSEFPLSYRLGIDVGGTFTDLLLTNDVTGEVRTAKIPSTPSDPSVAVLAGLRLVCQRAGIEPSTVTHVLHGTTVATNTLLTHSGAKVGLVTTRGHRQILQIARSFVPGGLGGWVIYKKPTPLAPLECTIEADERINAKGEIVEAFNPETLRPKLAHLGKQGIQALTVSLMNAYANDKHEHEIRELAEHVLTDIPISISSELVPEMREYERAITTVANSYVRPIVQRYVQNLQEELNRDLPGVKLHILRSDGGLASAESAERYPVNLLMSGPAGGVSGAIHVASQSGFKDLLTFDMGGTSTDVCLVENGQATVRRETTIQDVTVLASSVDVRTVGAGGGSIAHVPALTNALRVGPQSAGAEPGPAAYGKGGKLPTVTDANVVLGYLPTDAKLGGDMRLDREASVRAVQTIADAMGLSLERAAAGIIGIVNETMFGALRLVSVERGYDPRDFALIAFGGAGPLHANALGILMSSWPVIIPPGPGVLCAYGDATTRLRDDASRTFIRRVSQITGPELAGILNGLRNTANRALEQEGATPEDIENTFEVDLRYAGQGLQLTVAADVEQLQQGNLQALICSFEKMHEQLFTFSLDAEVELVNLRAVSMGKAQTVKLPPLDKGDKNASAAAIHQHSIFVDNEWHDAMLYDRSKLKAGNEIHGPAIVLEMDSTSLILNGYTGTVDPVGSILLQPN
jgi:N-methylhydantoinase A